VGAPCFSRGSWTLVQRKSRSSLRGGLQPWIFDADAKAHDHYAPVERQFILETMVSVPKQICHLDRSVPGFPAPLHRTRPRLRPSVKKGA
jgi:hypothetical protein